MRDEQLFEAFSEIDQYYLNEGVPHERSRRRFSKHGLICALIIVAILACLSFLFLRYSQYGFHLARDEYGYYLQSYKKDTYVQKPNIMGGIAIEAQNLIFHSVAEMREDFLTYNYTEDEINSIRALLEENGGKIKVPDLDHLCEPVCPGGYTFTGTVYWSGSNHYSFEIQSNRSPQVSIGGSSKEAHLKSVDRLINYSGDEIVEVIEKRQIETVTRPYMLGNPEETVILPAWWFICLSKMIKPYMLRNDTAYQTQTS